MRPILNNYSLHLFIALKSNITPVLNFKLQLQIAFQIFSLIKVQCLASWRGAVFQKENVPLA